MNEVGASRAASVGLAAVVLCLAAFSIFTAYTTRTQIDRAARADSLANSYEDGIAVFQAQERLKLRFFLDPSAESATRLEQAGHDIAEAVGQIAAKGGEEDAELVKDLLDLHDDFLAATERLLGAMAAGDPAQARRIDENLAQPYFIEMQDRLTAAAAQRVTESQKALAALETRSQWVIVAAPLVFAIGFALLLGLWRILSQNERARQENYPEIEQLSKLRAEFVSTVSHEFRTPLTGIQGFSEMMRDEEIPADLMREYAGDINKDAQRLNRLINNMLDLDQLEAGQMKLRVGPVDLNGILRETAARLTSNGARHRIELDLEEGLPKLKIFERYSRIETTATQNIQGTGLGLPIVRQIVQLSQGKVWATSGSGEGSTFHVELPLVTSA